MNFEEITNLTEDRKKELLKDIVMNDAEYWRKIYLLMNMETEDTDLLDLVIDNKRAEIELLEKQYKLREVKGFSFEELRKRDTSKVIETMLNDNEPKEKYGKAYKEVIEILKYIPDIYYKKINKQFLIQIEEQADNSYDFSINSDSKLSDIQLLDETKDILALISQKFWTNDIKNHEAELNQEIRVEEQVTSSSENKLIINEKWYKKIINKFRKNKGV